MAGSKHWTNGDLVPALAMHKRVTSHCLWHCMEQVDCQCRPPFFAAHACSFQGANPLWSALAGTAWQCCCQEDLVCVV